MVDIIGVGDGAILIGASIIFVTIVLCFIVSFHCWVDRIVHPFFLLLEVIRIWVIHQIHHHYYCYFLLCLDS